jgi:hypothetical protein
LEDFRSFQEFVKKIEQKNTVFKILALFSETFSFAKGFEKYYIGGGVVGSSTFSFAQCSQFELLWGWQIPNIFAAGRGAEQTGQFEMLLCWQIPKNIRCAAEQNTVNLSCFC